MKGTNNGLSRWRSYVRRVIGTSPFQQGDKAYSSASQAVIQWKAGPKLNLVLF